MTVEGELDDISGSGQTEAALDMCTGVPKAHKQHFEAKGAGHYGIFSGRRWRELVYPAVKTFILEAHNSANQSPRKQSFKPIARLNRALAAPKNVATVKPILKAVIGPTAKPVATPTAARTPVKAARRR